MALRAHHFGFSFVVAGVIFGALAVFAGENPHSSAAQSPRLATSLTPASAQLSIGTTAVFNVVGVYTDASGVTTNVIPATISWLPVGATVVSYNKNTIIIKAGTVAKTGNLGVDITYAGLSAHADAPVTIIAPAASATPKPTATPATPTPAPTVKPSPTPTPTPVLSTPGPLSDAEKTRLEALTSVFRPDDPTFSRPKVSLESLACLEKNLGARFADVSSGQSEPAAADRQAASGCFADADPLPVILAPLSPGDVPAVSADEAIVISDVKQVADASSHKVTGLQMSGKAAPSANVYLYVFSDPLVRHTSANADGNWTYFLNADLPVGGHEAFAVTAASAAATSFIRSAAFPVSIAEPVSDTAGTPAKSHLPDWLAPLHLPDWVTTRLLYAAGAGLMLLLSIISFAAVLRGRRRRQHKSALDALSHHMPGETIMPSELLAAAPIAPSRPVSVEDIVNSPIPDSLKPKLPGGTVPEEYRDDPQAPRGSNKS